jgi:hypothetical protein
MQRTSETSETIEIYVYNMRFSPFFHATQNKEQEIAGVFFTAKDRGRDLPQYTKFSLINK